jgi:DNA polymerase-3 subunit delta
MPVLQESQVLAALKKGDGAPVYLLVGDDDVGKARLVDALSAQVPEDLQAFNLERWYANERPLDQVVAAARTLPLLGERRVVLVLRCETFLKTKRKAGATDEESTAEDAGEASDAADASASGTTGELERYLASPPAETCLVLVSADLTRNTRLAKLLLKAAVVVEFWGLKTDREARGPEVQAALTAAEARVRQWTRDAGLRIGPDAVTILLEHAGTDIAVLRGDCERVITYCLGRPEVTAQDVRAVVAGAVQLSPWTLTNAIEEGDVREALRQLRLGFDAGQSPWMVLGQLGWFVRTKLAQRAPARLTPAVEALFRTDTALKSSGGEPEVLLERLVVELCGEDGRRAGGARHWRNN